MGTKLFKLYNHVKHYEWGSMELIPQFTGVENKDMRPCAEMWMGTHLSPSHVQQDGKMISLTQAVGKELPFLFKLLAVEKPLSIQAHPDKEQAQEGFERENKAGIPIDAHERNYKDSNHKPEIICALSPFTMMAGFREAGNIYLSLKSFMSEAPQLKEIITPLLRALEQDSLAIFLNVLFHITESEREYLWRFSCRKKNPRNGHSFIRTAADYEKICLRISVGRGCFITALSEYYYNSKRAGRLHSRGCSSRVYTRFWN